MPAWASDYRCSFWYSPVTESVRSDLRSLDMWIQAGAAQPTQGRDMQWPVPTMQCEPSIFIRATPRQIICGQDDSPESQNEFAPHRRQRAWNIPEMRKTSPNSCSTLGPFKQPPPPPTSPPFSSSSLSRSHYTLAH